MDEFDLIMMVEGKTVYLNGVKIKDGTNEK